jgi:hypothetical protein
MNDNGLASRILTRPAPQVPRLLLSKREAAQALGVSERFLFDITEPRGPIPVIRLNGRGGARALRYDVRDLLAYIDAQKNGQSAMPGALASPGAVSFRRDLGGSSTPA